MFGLLIGIGIHAVVDALRRATGSPARRLGWFFAVLSGLSLLGVGSDPGGAVIVAASFVTLATLNLLAAWSFRRAHRRPSTDD
ncbi:MAG: hypothetical protein AB1Z98_15380 [Nannocystaceae bacterium]